MARGSGSGSDAMSTKRPRSSGRNTTAWRHSHSPPRSGMFKSVTMTSNDCRRSDASASAASATVVTAQPRRANERAIASRIAGLSSTISADHLVMGTVIRVSVGYLDT